MARMAWRASKRRNGGERNGDKEEIHITIHQARDHPCFPFESGMNSNGRHASYSRGTTLSLNWTGKPNDLFVAIHPRVSSGSGRCLVTERSCVL